MKKDLLLLLSLMLLLSVSAIAGPRSYQQAKAIAQRQAAMLGIEMDAEVAASAKAAPRMSVSSAVSPSATCYYVFANGEDKGFTIVSGDDRMRKWWATLHRALTTPTICLPTMWTL